MTKRSILLTMFLVAATPFARASYADASFAAADSADQAPSDKEADLYSEGAAAIDDEQWPHAIDIFQRVVKMNGKRVDGALYWLAYAQSEGGRNADALETIATLEKSHPKSRWIKDAKALEIDIKQAAGQNVDPSQVYDEELKLIAIQGFMDTNPERALPLLQKLLDGRNSLRIKEQVLFVLSQSKSERAGQIIASIARGTTHPELQTEAIKYLGITGDRSVTLLRQIYDSTTNAGVKKEVLHAYLVANAHDALSQVARNEKDLDLRAEAIQELGAMGAARELEEIARTESNAAIRATAVRSLGLTDKARTGAALVSIYQSDRDNEVRRAAIEGLFIQSNAHALIDLARREKDPKWKREIVTRLAVMHSKEATDYLSSLLED